MRIFRLRPSNCRANEYNKYFLFERYVGFVQELTSVPTLLENLTAIAELEPKVKFLRGFLRLKPGTHRNCILGNSFPTKLTSCRLGYLFIAHVLI